MLETVRKMSDEPIHHTLCSSSVYLILLCSVCSVCDLTFVCLRYLLLCYVWFGLVWFVAHHLALALRSVIVIIISTSVFLPQCVLAAVCS